MEEIGLFPLGIVLLPTEHVPLHIFEPRYRELIGECIDRGSDFGLVYADEDGLRPIGTRASVVNVLERLDDGRLNIVVAGGERFRLHELTEGRTFHTGLVDPIDDTPDPAGEPEIERAVAAFNRLLGLAGADVEAPDAGDPQLSFQIAGRFELAADIKLELLAATSERARLVRVAEILEAAAADIERQRHVAAVAQKNGKPDPPS
jgi:Lon protease-like protein